jgi:hypothetical protein
VKSLTAYYKFASIDLGKQFAGAYAGLAEQTERETGTGRNSEIIDADLITDGTAHYNAAAAAADRSGSGRPSEREDFNSNVFIMGRPDAQRNSTHAYTDQRTASLQVTRVNIDRRAGPPTNPIPYAHQIERLNNYSSWFIADGYRCAPLQLAFSSALSNTRASALIVLPPSVHLSSVEVK